MANLRLHICLIKVTLEICAETNNATSNATIYKMFLLKNWSKVVDTLYGKVLFRIGLSDQIKNSDIILALTIYPITWKANVWQR